MQALSDNVTARTDHTPKREAALQAFSRFAWGVLFFNLLVIAVGTIVRATGSGDGCGSHWPLCDGEVIPLAPTIKKSIEFTHRVVSGIDGPLVIALVIGAFRLFPKGHRIRPFAVLSLVFTIVEALIGAVLVKKGLVAYNASVARAVVMSIHLTNTFFLLSFLAIVAWWASSGERLRLKGQGAVGVSLGIGFIAVLALGISGAVTALGDTLFPVKDHADALMQAQFGTHFLQQLRLLHPYIAGSVGLYLILIAGLVGHLRPSAATKRYSYQLGYIFLFEVALGFTNVLLRAPVFMQVAHLMVADFVWVTLVLLALSAFAESAPQVEMTPGIGILTAPEADYGKPGLRDYIVLTKPRVISLLLFTTLTAMVIAGNAPGARSLSFGQWVWLFVVVSIGGYAASGAANAINMVIDRDIDVRMRRTATRPTVTQKIPARNALYFGLALGLGAFLVLWLGANLLTAMLALAGLVYYVVIYTLLLKRRTWHNIVIGGAAGAFPPLVGWAAVAGDLKSVLAWYLFGIVFLWTPAHFWALALLIKDDYAEAGIPMLPVVLGDRVTVIQIAIYAVLTAVISIVPLAQGLVGIGYVIAAIVLNLIFIGLSAQLFLKTDRPHASRVFHYSMLYLALLFLAMAIDSAIRVS